MRLRVVTWLALAALGSLFALWVGVERFGSGGRANVSFPLLLDLSDTRFSDSPPGYIAVLPSYEYTPRRGFGWSQGVKAFDANTWPDDLLDLDSLHRDAHLGLNAIEDPGPSFIIDAPPGRYRLTVVSGASAHGVHALGLLVNDKEVLPLQELLPDGEPRVFTMTVSPVNGRIKLSPFTEYGTEWLISAIELRPLKLHD